jgi:hypothetical protein
MIVSNIYNYGNFFSESTSLRNFSNFGHFLNQIYSALMIVLRYSRLEKWHRNKSRLLLSKKVSFQGKLNFLKEK